MRYYSSRYAAPIGVSCSHEHYPTGRQAIRLALQLNRVLNLSDASLAGVVNFLATGRTYHLGEGLISPKESEIVCDLFDWLIAAPNGDYDTPVFLAVDLNSGSEVVFLRRRTSL